MGRELLPGDVEVSTEGVRFCEPEGYWGTLAPEKAQALAVEILARWPLERVERETMDDWKADASGYLKHESMLTRRFARRVVALVDGFNEALVELTAHVTIEKQLCGQNTGGQSTPGKPAKAASWPIGHGALKLEALVVLGGRETRPIEVEYRHIQGVWPREGDDLVILSGPNAAVRVNRTGVIGGWETVPWDSKRVVHLWLESESDEPVALAKGATWTVSVMAKEDEDGSEQKRS